MPWDEFKSWIVANPIFFLSSLSISSLSLKAMQHLFKSSYCVIFPQSMVIVEKTIRFLEMVGESKCEFPLPVKRIISILGLKRIEREWRKKSWGHWGSTKVTTITLLEGTYHEPGSKIQSVIIIIPKWNKVKKLNKKGGRKKWRRQSQGRGSAWAEKQQNQLVDPSMLNLFPVFVCLSQLSHSLNTDCYLICWNAPKKPATLMAMALCSHLSYLC